MTETTTTPPRSAAVHHRADYRVPDFLIDTVELRFDLHADHATVTALSGVRRNPAARDQGAPLVLDGEELELLSVAIDGKRLTETAFSVDEETLTLAAVGDAFTLETVVRIRPQDNTSYQGLFRTGGTFCTQCEAQGFRRITYFLDRPDVMATYTVTVEADRREAGVLLSNGNRTDSGESADGRHWARFEDPFAKPSYLFALVAGDLEHIEDRFTTASGREVRLAIYAEAENIDRCDHAMASLKKAMEWDERVYGLECDLDEYKIVATDAFNMGAMENKGLNVFNSLFVLARQDTATDDNYEAVEGVIAHEYFHNWTGNRVTCRDWFQLSLKEGLTVFRDQEFSADMTSRAVKRIADVRVLRSAQFAEDAGPMSHPVRPESYIEMNNFYTLTVYNKGAEVVRMIHTLVGAEGFRRGMDLYFERHDGQAVTCDDFRAAMADANEVDLEQFERWYLQAGTPVVEASGVHDPERRTYTLRLSQNCPPTPGQQGKLPFHVPVAVGLLGHDGRDLPLRLEGEETDGATTRVLELRESEQTFTFLDVETEPVPSLLRGFSAPVRLECERPRSQLAFAMAHDSDSFNRWDAGERFATEMLLEMVGARSAGQSMELDPAYFDAFARVLADPELDPSLKALALTLPAETWLAEQMEVVDPQGIHAARAGARAQLATRLHGEFWELFHASAADGPSRTDQASIGRRRLRAVALSYLVRSEAADCVPTCFEAFEGADNMTDSQAALALLCHFDRPERERALAAFYERWEHNALVIDKWFGVQALSELPDALARVDRLLEHPAFTLTNPNRARSLLGTFCAGNPARFHDASGAGYGLLAEQVRALDALNPQAAARVITPLLRWERFEPGRGERMRERLEELLAAESLSKDLYEKVSKSLARPD
ncbi:MAG: aminopeptidase N [Planctomycetota bacterium]|jgi:aminopeptidase N|nr:aminopeptidase N [Planctomycetota bacterium]MDP6763740.1 aminopeptidase N [Planctomycetota bacterium]MDP6989234.1 aminopeptidase N [Planctomycetota bacterium]